MRMLIAVLILCVSCAKPVAKPNSGVSPQAGKADKPVAKDDMTVNAAITSPNEDERVSPPSQVSGAALRCSVTKDLLAEDTVVGCRFDDANGKRIPAKNLADRAVYSFVPPLDPSVKVKMHNLDANAAFDVAYVFSAGSKEKAEAAAMLTRVLVSFEGLKVNLPPVVSGVIKDILVMGAEILKGLAHIGNVIAGEIQRKNAE